MRLDRYTGDHEGRYSIIENKTGRTIHIGDPKDDFFVIKLRDINAKKALKAYAKSAKKNGDKELAKDVMKLRKKSGKNHPHCHKPD